MIVGAVVARHIRQLMRLFGNKPSQFTLVGHSLGAHTAGFVGKRFQGKQKLRMILGLDPAGPCFTDQKDTYRLNPNDARLVVTIHTNGGKVIGENFGIFTPLGHYSFFPNGGSQQPGCEKAKAVLRVLMKGVVGGLTDSLACSHRRATRLVAFNESLLTQAHAVGYKCKNYEDYSHGECSKCDENDMCKPFNSWFGWWQDQVPSPSWTKPVSYYLDTTNGIPYTVYAFQVIVSEIKSVDTAFSLISKLQTLHRLKREISPPGMEHWK